MSRKQLLFIALIISVYFFSGCSESENIRKNRFLLKGNAALEDHNEEQAIQYFREAIKIDSCFADAHNNIGTVFFRQQKFTDALESYNRSIACRPGYLNSYFNRSNTLYELSRPYEALIDVEKVLLEKPDTVPALFLQGLIFTKMKAFEKAQEAFSKALKRDSLNVEVLVNIGTICFYQKNYPVAKDYLNKAISINSKEANAFNALSLVEVATNNLDEALVTINKAIDQKPGNPFFRNNRGYIHLLKNELVLALEDIDYSISTDPYNAWAYRNKGIYYLKKNDATSAIRLLNQAVLLEPYAEKGYYYLAQAYYEARDYANACKAWQESLSRNEADGQNNYCKK